MAFARGVRTTESLRTALSGPLLVSPVLDAAACGGGGEDKFPGARNIGQAELRMRRP